MTPATPSKTSARGRTLQEQAPESLYATVRRALAWSTFGTVLLRIGNLVIGIVAARLLVPAEFGIFAVALIVHSVIINISDVGVSAYLVRHPAPSRTLVATVLTLALLVSVGLACGMALFARQLAGALGGAQATDVIRALSITVVLAGFTSVPGAMLIRAFRQKARFAADGCGFVVSSVFLVVLALSGQGAMALAWSRVLGALVSAAIVLLLAPRLPRPSFDAVQAVALMRFGLPLVGNSLIGFVLLNIDYVIISRLLGSEKLGIYYLAFNIANWPYMIVAPVLSSVALAGLARVVSTPERFVSVTSKGLSLLLAVTLPASLLIAVLASPLVETLYGAKWLPATTALVYIAVFSAVKVPVDLLSNVGLALGRTGHLLMIQVFYGALLVPMTYALVARNGIAGAGQAHVLAAVTVLLPATVIVAVRGTALTARELCRPCLPPVIASVLSALAAFGVAHLLVPTSASSTLSLFLGGVAGVSLYTLMVGRWLRRTVASLRGGEPPATGLSFPQGEPATVHQEATGR